MMIDLVAKDGLSSPRRDPFGITMTSLSYIPKAMPPHRHPSVALEEAIANNLFRNPSTSLNAKLEKDHEAVTSAA